MFPAHLGTGQTIELDDPPGLDAYSVVLNHAYVAREFGRGKSFLAVELNLYQYAQGNPVGKIDPSGLSVEIMPGGLSQNECSSVIPINSLAACLAACEAIKDFDAGQQVRCAGVCRSLVSFGCDNLGKLCYRLKLKKNVEVCLSLCLTNCPPNLC